MTRWSFIKRVGAVTHEEFASFARLFCDAAAQQIKNPLNVSVIFYRKLPYSVTTMSYDAEREWLNAFNKKRELAVLDGVGGFNNKELFEQAVFVKMIICPVDSAKAPQHAFGILKCKGWLPSHIIYYFQPKEVGDPVQARLTNRIPYAPRGFFRRLFRLPPKALFTVGDGFEENHPISFFC